MIPTLCFKRFDSGDEVIIPKGTPCKSWVNTSIGMTTSYGSVSEHNVGKVMFMGEDGYAMVITVNGIGRYEGKGIKLLASGLIYLYDKPTQDNNIIPNGESSPTSAGGVDDGGTPWHAH